MMPADANSAAALRGSQTPPLNQSHVVVMTKPRPLFYTASSMQIAGIGTCGTGTCGTWTAGLGHAELGQFCDSFA